MAWFKKDESVPEIPPALKLPELPKNLQNQQNNVNSNQTEERTAHLLPELSKTSLGENLNHEIVKSAVSDDESSGEKEVNGVQELPRNFKFQQPRESSIPPAPEQAPEQQQSESPGIPSIPAKPQEPRTLEMHGQEHTYAPGQGIQAPPAPHPHAKRPVNEPVFVRIDKFQESKKSFDDIRKKLKNIEQVLGKIKDIKLKEDQEVALWTEDLEKLKIRLDEIDTDIFNKI